MITWRVLFRVTIIYCLSTAASLLKILSFAPLLPPCSEKLNLTSWIQFIKKLKNKLENKQKIKNIIFITGKRLKCKFKKLRDSPDGRGITDAWGRWCKLTYLMGISRIFIICLEFKLWKTGFDYTGQYIFFDVKYFHRVLNSKPKKFCGQNWSPTARILYMLGAFVAKYFFIFST